MSERGTYSPYCCAAAKVRNALHNGPSTAGSITKFPSAQIALARPQSRRLDNVLPGGAVSRFVCSGGEEVVVLMTSYPHDPCIECVASLDRYLELNRSSRFLLDSRRSLQDFSSITNVADV